MLNIKKSKVNSEKQSYTCPSCGKTFTTPILVENLSSATGETYEACPYCLTKIETEKPTKKKTAVTKSRKVKKEVRVKQKIVQRLKKEVFKPSSEKHRCPHYLGYLATRPKGEAIPEECLTCTKIVECMLKKAVG